MNGVTAAELTADILPVLKAEAAITDELACFPEKSMRMLREQRLMSLSIPKAYGGGGADLALCLEVARALATACLSTAQIWAMHVSHLDSLIRYGSPELKAAVLPRIAAEELFIASATTEAGRGSNLFTADAPLQAGNDDMLHLERAAPTVTGGAHADGFLITMRASEQASPHQVTLVYADRSEVQVETSSGWETMGMRGTESIGIIFRGLVPPRNVVGNPGEFAVVARESMIPVAHLTWAACWLGAASGCLADFIDWAVKSGKMTDLFYERLGTIRLDLELVSAYLARVSDEVERCRATDESLAQPHHQLHVNGLKIIASELAFRAVDGLVRLGGLRVGYTKNGPVALERAFRDLRAGGLMHSNDDMRIGVGAMTLLDRAVRLA